MSTDALFKRMLELNLPFDQLIYEGGKESVWVHVSFRDTDRRQVIMRATFPAAGGVDYAKLTREAALVMPA